MSGAVNSVNKALKIAKAKDCEVVQSRYSRLLLDLDSFNDLAYYHKSLPLLTELLQERGYTLKVKDQWTSKSGNGEHVYLIFPKKNKSIFSLSERLLLECILGSDRKRALLSFMNYLDGEKEPNLLFKPRKK